MMSSLVTMMKNARSAQWFCRGLVVFSLLVLAAYWANRLAATRALEDAAVGALEHRASALTAAVSEQTRGVIYNLDLALRHLAQLHAQRDFLTVQDVEEIKHSTPRGLVRRVTLIDRSGRGMVSYPAGASGLRLDDRPHFRAHAFEGHVGLYIGRPIESRIDSEWLIPLSRRLSNREGQFAGVIAVLVSPIYFAEIYRRITAGRDDVVALLYQDGTFLSRSVGLAEHLGKTVRPDRPFVGPQAAESGVFRSFSTHEPVDRVFAFQRLREWPLITAIGLGVAEPLAALRAGRERDAQSAIAVSGLVLLLVAGICVVVMRLQRSLERTRESDERRAMAFAGADELAWEWDLPGRRLRFFGNCRVFFGGSDDERQMPIEQWLPLVHPDERAALLRQTADFVRGRGDGKEIRFRLRVADGRYRWVLLRGQRVGFDDFGKLTRALGILMDIDTARRAEIEAAQTREAYRRLVESTGEGIFVVDQGGVIRLFNPAAERLLGWRADEVIGRRAESLFDPAERATVLCPVSSTLRDGETRRGIRLSYRHKDGRPVPVEVCVAPLVIDHQAGGAVTVVTDVSQRLAYEAELERLARTDGLTGLWNRRYFVELCGREMNRAERDATPLSLLMIDLDHFKAVNDRHGHAAGDAVLCALAGHFRSQLRLIDVIGRLGGEEFGVGLPAIGLDEALGVAERMRAGLEGLDIDAAGAQLRCTVSIGIAEWNGSESFDVLLARADAALYAAKRQGRNRVLVDRPLSGAASA